MIIQIKISSNVKILLIKLRARRLRYEFNLYNKTPNRKISNWFVTTFCFSWSGSFKMNTPGLKAFIDSPKSKKEATFKNVPLLFPCKMSIVWKKQRVQVHQIQVAPHKSDSRVQLYTIYDDQQIIGDTVLVSFTTVVKKSFRNRWPTYRQAQYAHASYVNIAPPPLPRRALRWLATVHVAQLGVTRADLNQVYIFWGNSY